MIGLAVGSAVGFYAAWLDHKYPLCGKTLWRCGGSYVSIATLGGIGYLIERIIVS